MSIVREDEVGARLLIKNEIEQSRRQLRDTEEEYQTLQTQLQELADTRRRLRLKIEQLLQDERALTRGHMALTEDVIREASNVARPKVG